MAYFLKHDKVVVTEFDGNKRYGIIEQTWIEHCYQYNMPEYAHLQKYLIRSPNGNSSWRYGCDIDLVTGKPEEVILTTFFGYKYPGIITGGPTYIGDMIYFNIEYIYTDNGKNCTERGGYPETWLSRR